MSRKLVLLMILIIVLVGMLGLVLRVQRVKANDPIYIRADGRVDPQTAPISSVNNITYTFTDNVYDSVVVERSNIIIDGNGYTLQGSGSGNGLTLVDTNNVTIKEINVKNFNFGIFLNSSHFNTISGNAINHNTHGIQLNKSCFNIVSANKITENLRNVFLKYFSSNNTLSGNAITFGDFALFILQSSNNTVSRNKITDNYYDGIQLNTAFNNTFSLNNITANNHFGIRLDSSSKNKFYQNNIAGNTQQVYIGISSDANFWDNDVEGNFWSNYAGVDLNHDGIGDSPHVIDANNSDNYPLMGMFSSFNTTLGTLVNVVSNSTIESFECLESNGTIKMHVSNMTTIQTHGFCRVCINKDLVAPNYTVIIDDGLTEALHFNDFVDDNSTHRWIYFAYEHSIHEIDIISEFTFLLLPLIMIASLLTALHKSGDNYTKYKGARKP